MSGRLGNGRGVLARWGPRGPGHAGTTAGTHWAGRHRQRLVAPQSRAHRSYRVALLRAQEDTGPPARVSPNFTGPSDMTAWRTCRKKLKGDGDTFLLTCLSVQLHKSLLFRRKRPPSGPNSLGLMNMAPTSLAAWVSRQSLERSAQGPLPPSHRYAREQHRSEKQQEADGPEENLRRQDNSGSERRARESARLRNHLKDE